MFYSLSFKAFFRSGCKLLSADELGNINEWWAGLAMASLYGLLTQCRGQVSPFCGRYGDIDRGRSIAAGADYHCYCLQFFTACRACFLFIVGGNGIPLLTRLFRYQAKSKQFFSFKRKT